ncbi:hypothetical protein [Azospirillum brasilense]|uniref:hypothetical protein n=1 Tax=Azospirillum brasilense TaxID=192 RepID=UPI00039B669C|nr:hypothetical protein [Azospirillum brasilense]
MNRNGPVALVFHTLFLAFLLAPILVVCVVAFTSQGYLSLPTEGLSLRWFKAIGDNPEFARAFRDSLLLGAVSSTRRWPSPATSSAGARRSRRCSCRR